MIGLPSHEVAVTAAKQIGVGGGGVSLVVCFFAEPLLSNSAPDFHLGCIRKISDSVIPISDSDDPTVLYIETPQGTGRVHLPLGTIHYTHKLNP